MWTRMVDTEDQANQEVAEYKAQGKRVSGPIWIIYNGRKKWQYGVWF